MEEKQKDQRTGARAPVKVLSTSLGVALAAHMLLTPGMFGEAQVHAAADEPKLTEWSTEAVKQYFNPSLDWSLPLPDNGAASASPSPSPGASGGGSAAPVVIHQGGGFGWDDLLLYHLLFNRGGSYSSSGWHRSHPVYDPRTNQPYKPKTYSTGAFENKPVPGTNVKPKTSASSGSFTTKQGASSSKPGTSGSTTSSSSSGKSTTSSSGSTSSGSVSSGSSSSSSSSGKSTSSSSGSIGGKSSGFSGSGGSSSGS